MHTHAIDATETTPYLAINSAEKQSGKSLLLEVLKLLVDNPWYTGRVTAAVLYRKIDHSHPTLLLDETDAAFGGEQEYAEALRGILNTGHQFDGVASACIGQGANMSFRDFSTFCPKALAGLNKLPDTVADRSIRIRLKRKAHGEHVERFRRRKIAPEAEPLRSQIATWSLANIERLQEARPDLPEELSDRQQDGAEPLLAIADRAGGDRPDSLRRALVELCAEAQAADGSIGVQLLGDIRQIFDSRGIERLSSVALVAALCDLEGAPWAEWGKSEKPITPEKMAKLLKPYEIHPHSLREGEKVFKGYETSDFADAWNRYLPPTPGNAVTAVTRLQPASTKPNIHAPCNSVTGVTAPRDGGKAGTNGDTYVPDPHGPGCTCRTCGSHFGTVAGWRYHIASKRCSQGRPTPCETLN